METAAYWIALVTIALASPMMLIWFVIHPFTNFWCRLGPLKTYLTVSLILLPIPALIIIFREPVMQIHFGVKWYLIIPAVILFAAGSATRISRRKSFKESVRLGVPQLSKDKSKVKLVTGGIFAHVRNPVYIEGFFGILGVALFCNYLALYIVIAAYVPIMYSITLLEERELRERFGEEYEEYCRAVPRFIPGFKK